MIRPPPSSTRADTLFPSTTLCRSAQPVAGLPVAPGLADRRDPAVVHLRGDAARDRPPRPRHAGVQGAAATRSEEHTPELQSLMRLSHAVLCLKKKIRTRSGPQSAVSRSYISPAHP